MVNENICSHFLGISRPDDPEQQRIILAEASKRAGTDVGEFFGMELTQAIDQVPGILILDDELDQECNYVFWA